jgi:hypothetical protein
VSSSLEPTAENFRALAVRPADAPVVMVNLLKFKVPGGWERYLQYGREVAPHLERILVVEYPSPQAFIDMVTTQEYAKVHEHRAAGLDRGDLIATSAWSVAAD